MKIFTYIGVAALAVLAFYVGFQRCRNTTPAACQTGSATLIRQCDSLQNVIHVLRARHIRYDVAIDSLEREMERNAAAIKENTVKHENESVHIGCMPDDSLLRFFTEYVNR